MKQTVSYGVRIVDAYQVLFETMSLYRICVKKLMAVSLEHYDEIRDKSPLEARRIIELLIHSSRSHKARYPFFDQEFPKFPSYLRRSAIQEAIGIVVAYKEQVERWETLPENERSEKPHLTKNPHSMPVLYRGNCFKLLDGHRCLIKIYHQNDWVWFEFKLNRSDFDYLKRKTADYSCPTLERRGHRFELRFSYETQVELPTKVRRICAVDLGVNTMAVCSIMEADGTVMARKFIDFPIEKDRMYTMLGRIKRAHANGNRKTPRLWRCAKYYNRELSIKTSSAITSFAKAWSADCIVFEYLNPRTSGRTRNQRIALWRKRDIQKRTEAIAHQASIRISRVNAWKTSSYAFDGSGVVKRDPNNHQLCVFKTGKQYNCDLSASYNIGARYFIRDIIKSLSETEELAVSANVPELVRRTGGLTAIHSTLSTLINLNAALEQLAPAC